MLKERYNCPWLVQEKHIRSIVDVAFVKNGSNKELCYLYDAVIQYYWTLKEAKNNSFEMVQTVILQQKLDKKTQLKSAEFNSDSKNVPPCTEFLKFLDLHARHLECVSYWTQTSLQIWSKVTCQTIFPITHRYYIPSMYSIRSEVTRHTPGVYLKDGY